MSPSDLLFILPELILALGGSVLLLVPAFGFRGEPVAARYALAATVIGAAVALFAVHGSLPAQSASPSLAGMFALDGFAVFFKYLLLATVLLVALLSEDYLDEDGYSFWEFGSLLLFALCGMFFMVSGIHLISIYIGLELMSLSSYVLAGYYKAEEKSTEAAMKYFILGGMSSATLLYGISLIYGACGTLQLQQIENAIASGGMTTPLVVGVILLGAGLSFKISAVPFHVWTPDVYVGAPTPITAFLSTASKAAAFAMFARIFYDGLSGMKLEWSAIVAAIAALSMIIGNLAAITQDNVKRMLAWSSIGHAGYALLGILAMSRIGLTSVLIYMLVYVFATMGIWSTVLVLRRHEYAGESVTDFEGLNARAPFWAFAMVVFLLSLGGIPPTSGFIGKYFLFAAAVEAGYVGLAVIAVLMSAVSMFYYFRLVVAMYLREGKEARIVSSPPLVFAVAVCLAITLGVGLAPERLVTAVRNSIGEPSVSVARR